MSTLSFSDGGGGGVTEPIEEEEKEEEQTTTSDTADTGSTADATQTNVEQYSTTQGGSSQTTQFTKGTSTEDYWSGAQSRIEEAGGDGDSLESTTIESDGDGDFRTDEGGLNTTSLSLNDGTTYTVEEPAPDEADTSDNDPTNEPDTTREDLQEQRDFYREQVKRQNDAIQSLREQLANATSPEERQRLREQIRQARLRLAATRRQGRPGQGRGQGGGGLGGGGSDSGGIAGTGISGKQAAAAGAVGGAGLGAALYLGVL